MFILNPRLMFHGTPGQVSGGGGGPVIAPTTPDTPGQQAAAPVAPSLPAAPPVQQPAPVVDPTNPQATPANPTGAPATPPNPADIVTPPAQPGQQPAGASPAGGQQPPWGDRPEDFNPDQAWQLIQNLRTDVTAANSRVEQAVQQATQTATQAMAQQIGQALGLVQPNQPADPAELLQQAQAQNQQYATQLRTMQEENAVRAASQNPALNANADLLLPYLRGSGALQALDPNAPDYAVQVTGVIQGLVTQFPQFRQVQVAQASGAPAVQPTGTPAPVTKGIEEYRQDIRNAHAQRV